MADDSTHLKPETDEADEPRTDVAEGTAQGGESSEDAKEERRLSRHLRRFTGAEDFALWLRILLFLLGWLLILVGIAGLVLPGIQGIVTLLAGAAVLSLVSEVAYESLRWCFRVWPRGWRKVAHWRRSLRRRLMRWTGRGE